MISQNNYGQSWQISLNKLVQTGTSLSNSLNVNNLVIVSGNGSDLKNQRTVLNRAKRKQITKILALELRKIAEDKGNKKLARTFRNTIFCMEKLYVKDGKVHGEYCKNRICLVCLGIRKADIINRYLPIISEWEEPHFLTLTVKAVPARRLRYLIANIQLGFNRIIAKYKKRSQRGNGQKLMGIKSLECNFNAKKRTYNPHFHIIVPNKLTGEILRSEWIKRAKRKNLIDERAQPNFKIKNPKKCLIEVVKYGSKIFTEPDVTKKNQKGYQRQIYVMALYTILEAMQGHRLFDRFGFNLPKQEAYSGTTKILVSPDEFNYDLKSIDWVNINSGSVLSGYCPEPKLNFLLESCINAELA